MLGIFRKNGDEDEVETKRGFETYQSTVNGSVVTTKQPAPRQKPFWQALLELLLTFLALLLLLILVIYLVWTAAHKAGVDSVVTSQGYSTPVEIERVAEWLDVAEPSLFYGYSLAEAETLKGSRFDQLAFGHQFNTLNEPEKAYYFLTLAAVRGSTLARQKRDEIILPVNVRNQAMDDVVQTLFNGGRDGNFLMGMLHLQNDAFRLAQHPDSLYCYYFTDEQKNKLNLSVKTDRERAVPTWPPCEKNFQLLGAASLVYPNDILDRSDEDAYVAFARASQCYHPEASLWMNAMENDGLIDYQTAVRLQGRAKEDVKNGGDRFCTGATIDSDPEKPIPPANGGNRPSPRRTSDAAVLHCSLDDKQGLQKAQRDRPGRGGYDPTKDADAAPICEDGGATPPSGSPPYDGFCDESEEALRAADEARVCLRLGDAMLSAGDVDLALEYYRASIDRGRRYGAQSSLIAGDRLRALAITCEYSTKSLARIARGTLGYNIIDLAHRQRALKALGFYGGRVDGKYGRQTREGVRAFQREFGFDETGALSSLETVLLMCQAAETKSDKDAQNVLGIMYAAGLGVVQNTDLALEWFERSARRGSPDAYYNLARIYATGTVLSSYRLCDIVENDERAKSYYDDAIALGHEGAKNESFADFKARVVGESATGLERVGRSCGRPPRNLNEGQNQ